MATECGGVWVLEGSGERQQQRCDNEENCKNSFNFHPRRSFSVVRYLSDAGRQSVLQREVAQFPYPWTASAELADLVG